MASNFCNTFVVTCVCRIVSALMVSRSSLSIATLVRSFATSVTTEASRPMSLKMRAFRLECPSGSMVKLTSSLQRASLAANEGDPIKHIYFVF